MEDEQKNTEEVTEVEETQTQNQVTTEETQPKTNTSYVKIREEKAREKIFKELGVKDVEEAKTKLANADKALQKVEELEARINRDNADRERELKVKKLTTILDNENVFDSDALINYLDLDEVELDAKGNIKDSAEIISQLKELKPKYFGKQNVKSDTYVKNDTDTKNPATDYDEDYKAGNYQAVIAKYLKSKK